ncbi:MAG: hypothetical protein NC293_08875 [Roseburia sp.]|nr:hypothetical protein [Roseburia sp.]
MIFKAKNGAEIIEKINMDEEKVMDELTNLIIIMEYSRLPKWIGRKENNPYPQKRIFGLYVRKWITRKQELTLRLATKLFLS